MLTQERIKNKFDYDSGALIRKSTGKAAGVSLCTSGYPQITVDKIPMRTHQAVFLWHHGYLPEEIDHINRIRTDNRIENLRAATKSINMQNISVRRDSLSGVTGVSWRSDLEKWSVEIQRNGVKTRLGVFSKKEQAAAAYAAAYAEYAASDSAIAARRKVENDC